MTVRRKGHGFWAFVGAAILTVGCSSEIGVAPVNNVPAAVEEDAQRLTADLATQGFQVARGYFKLYSDTDCIYSYQTMKSCYANNPAAPYILFAVPPWPEEFVDPATKLAFGWWVEGYDGSFRLDPREAIVIFGLMPPPGAYYGLQTYLFTREGTYQTDSAMYRYIQAHFSAMLPTFFHTVPQNTDRIQVNASLGNSNNSVVVQQQSGAAFDQERFFIITPDQVMDGAVRASLTRIAVDPANVLTEPIPAVPGDRSTVTLGLDEHADDLYGLMRYAMPLDGGGIGTASYTWRRDLPLVVLRVRDTRPGRPAQPYGPAVLDARTAVDESGLRNDLAALAGAVNSRWGQPCAAPDCADRGTTDFIDLQASLDLVGPQCASIGMDCLADTQDTSYHGTMNQSLDGGEVYAAVGTLGTETGNATYVGLSVNESLMVKGLANIDNAQLKDTALSYAGQVGHADKFYVYYFTRDCSDLVALTEGRCFSIPETMIQPCTSPATQPCDYLKLVQREYIPLGSRRGPDSTGPLPPKLLKLKRR